MKRDPPGSSCASHRHLVELDRWDTDAHRHALPFLAAHADAGIEGQSAAHHPDDGEEAGSSSYVPDDKAKDTQLSYALELMLGLIAGHPIEVSMIGDASLSRRPMGRVLNPLRQMGLEVVD